MLKKGMVALVIAGSLWLAPASTQARAPRDDQIEELLGVRVGPKRISFQVRTQRCTLKSDFEVQIFESEPLQLLLVRNRPDHCEAIVPYGKWIRFSHQELGLRNGDRMRVVNPLSTVLVALFPR